MSKIGETNQRAGILSLGIAIKAFADAEQPGSIAHRAFLHHAEQLISKFLAEHEDDVFIRCFEKHVAGLKRNFESDPPYHKV